MDRPQRLAGIELGGTKGIAVLAHDAKIIEQRSVPTGTPDETLGQLNEILRGWHDEAAIEGLGIATFGPVRLDRSAPDFACMLDTPKPGWSGAAIGAALASGLDCNWKIDTDVNAAALAELHYGAGQGCNSLCYITIGTGVGGGLIVAGKPVHGALHPEIGHIVTRRARGDTFKGACRFHGDCIEGLISGPALAERFGMAGVDIPDDHPGWRYVAQDIGELVANILLTTSANRILFGGSVSLSREFLFPWVRHHALKRLGQYLPFFDKTNAVDIIGFAGLAADAGPLGAIVLAASAADNGVARSPARGEMEDMEG